MDQTKHFWAGFSLRFLTGIVAGILIGSFASQIGDLAHRQSNMGSLAPHATSGDFSYPWQTPLRVSNTSIEDRSSQARNV